MRVVANTQDRPNEKKGDSIRFRNSHLAGQSGDQPVDKLATQPLNQAGIQTPRDATTSGKLSFTEPPVGSPASEADKQMERHTERSKQIGIHTYI